MTHVKHLQEALQRFNPDAYLTPNVDMQGVSPATECVITVEGFRGEQQLREEITGLEEDILKMERQLAEIDAECRKEKPNLSTIQEICSK